MRYPLLIGNWKLNGSKSIVMNFITVLRQKMNKHITCQIAIAPPIVYLDLSSQYLLGSPIDLGAQNVDIHLSGAFTGEVSAAMLKDIGVKYVIIGHSERRNYHKESNEDIANKFALLKSVGLIPVLCIGESEMEKKHHKTETVCARQLDVILNHIGENAFENTVIAYEPIWAIGTGTCLEPHKVQKIHQFIRKYISQQDSQKVLIQYGGSVNIDNAPELFSQPDIDGALVGKASLQMDHFFKLAEILSEKKKKIYH